MAKYIKNNTMSDKVWLGKTVASNEYYLIPADKEIHWSSEDAVLIDIANSEAIIAKTNDGTTDITEINSAIDFLKNNLPVKVENQDYPFAHKSLPDGSKVFRRVRGVSSEVQNAPVNIDLVIPFAQCKITGLQIIGAKLGDKATFQVLDTSSGTISGVPNAVLNTFGQDVYVAPDNASYPSKYDADLIQGLTLRIVYDAKDELLPRYVYVNFDLHEVVSP